MSLLDIRMEDVRRVATVLSNMEDGPGISVSRLWEEVRKQAAANPEPPSSDSPFIRFSNPPPPLQNIEASVREGLQTVKDAIAERYGAEYADDLWKRVQQ